MAPFLAPLLAARVASNDQGSNDQRVNDLNTRSRRVYKWLDTRGIIYIPRYIKVFAFECDFKGDSRELEIW